jgi:DNA (cytosine-5)-methyltransferase 1
MSPSPASIKGKRGTDLGPSIGALLPTPAAGVFNDGETVESWQARNDRLRAQGINGNGMGTPLPIAVQLLKTPTAQLAVNGGSQHPDKRREGGHGPTLADQVEHELLPTPAARDWKSGKSNIMDRNARPLNEVVEHLLPTPMAADGERQSLKMRRGNPTLIGSLLPTPTPMDSRASRNTTAKRTPGKVAWHAGDTLTDAVTLLPAGDSTSSPSGAGSTSLAGELPGQLSLDEPESA